MNFKSNMKSDTDLSFINIFSKSMTGNSKYWQSINLFNIAFNTILLCVLLINNESISVFTILAIVFSILAFTIKMVETYNYLRFVNEFNELQ